MLLNPADFEKKDYAQILNLYRMRPVPQPPVWETVAMQFKNKGQYFEACCVIHLMMRQYGKSTGRTVYERIFGVPMNQCGRGINHICHPADHPAVFTLRDQTPPLRMRDQILLRCGSNVLMVQLQTAKMAMIGAISDNPSTLPKASDPLDRKPIQWIAIDNILVYAHGTHALNLVEIPDHVTGDMDAPLRHAVIPFESPIKRLCGPLDDGTFFVTLESPIPILSDICRLCRIHPEAFRNDEGDLLNRNILLNNVEQTLRGDCCANKNGFLTCGGGMQNHEVRMIEPDGSWTTKFVHEFPVLRIIQSEKGPVSLDESGMAILWDGTKPVDDFQFDAVQIPKIFLQTPEETTFTIDWTHKRLYMTVTTPPQSTLTAALKASHSCCLSAEKADEDTFVKQLHHCGSQSVAMLADGSFYLWDVPKDCVCAQWQMLQGCAEQKDWHEILAVRSPAIEQDPRIQIWMEL